MADSAYLFCGLGAFQGSGSDGLLLLKRLSPARMHALSADINLDTAVAPRPRPGAVTQPTVSSLLGTVAVQIRVLDGGRIALDAKPTDGERADPRAGVG